jgi:hypothetical protein
MYAELVKTYVCELFQLTQQMWYNIWHFSTYSLYVLCVFLHVYDSQWFCPFLWTCHIYNIPLLGPCHLHCSLASADSLLSDTWHHYWPNYSQKAISYDVDISGPWCWCGSMWKCMLSCLLPRTIIRHWKWIFHFLVLVVQ